MVNIETVLRKVNDFPTLPTIYTQLMNVISNPRSTVQNVADVIIKDQATTSKLLKVVNSPVYGIQGTVNNISQAIFYLGFNEVKNIVLSLSVMEIFSKTESTDYFNVLNLWKHSIGVGVISKIVGLELGYKNTEDFFVAGIIHDIGMLFYVKGFKNMYQAVIGKAIENNLRIAEVEKEVFGMTHYTVGELIAEKWRLPKTLRDIIRFQKSGSIHGKLIDIVSVVHLSNIIAKMLGADYQRMPAVPEPNFKIWEKLNFNEAALARLYPPIKDAYSQAVSILKLK